MYTCMFSVGIDFAQAEGVASTSSKPEETWMAPSSVPSMQVSEAPKISVEISSKTPRSMGFYSDLMGFDGI